MDGAGGWGNGWSDVRSDDNRLFLQNTEGVERNERFPNFYHHM